MKMLDEVMPIILAMVFVFGFFMIIFMFIVHDDNIKLKMAEMGLQECLVDSKVLWQRECGGGK